MMNNKNYIGLFMASSRFFIGTAANRVQNDPLVISTKENWSSSKSMILFFSCAACLADRCRYR